LSLLRDFVKNYEDMSDDNGFQFKFYCDVCRDGFLTKYRQAPFAKARSFLGAASSIGSNLGSGVFGRVGGGGQGAAQHMHDSKWREAHEKALDEAMGEARAHFSKCPGCTKYVDANCWNEQVQMCVSCSPRQTVVVAQARAQAFGQKAQEAMNAQDYSTEISGAQEVRILCPACKKPTSSGKFCEVCGAPLSKQACPTCGSTNSVTAMFCNNCGGKLRQ
jgi:hypothetical protein